MYRKKGNLTLLTCVAKLTQGTLEKLKARIVVRGDIQKTTTNEDPWSGTVASRTMKLFLATAAKLKKAVKQIDFISAFIQANVRGRHFVKLPSEYKTIFPEYTRYFGVPLLLKKGMYGMTLAANSFA